MLNANENLDPVPQDGTEFEPTDLAEAFKALNQANREAAQEPVEAGEGTEAAAGESENPEPDATAASEESATSIGESGNGAIDDGLAGGIEAIDFNAYKQQMLRRIQQDAVNSTRKTFADEGIGYYSAAELTVRDEQTGQVRFRNPDISDERDPNYYFKSRAEMQQFVEAWNRGVDFEFRKAVNEKSKELANNAAPTARVMDFMPKWQAMDPQTKAVFDDLLEGHEIRNAEGKEIGYDVDLDAVAAQAAKIAKRFPVANKQERTAPQQKASTASNGPALDLPSGSGVSEDEQEPTNIGEALKMYDKKNRGGK